MRDLVHELDGLAIGMAAHSLARRTVSDAAREIERLRAELADYRAMVAEQRYLVRRLDVALNGAGAAEQASLCDLISQFEKH